jgi:hypothetical protein
MNKYSSLIMTLGIFLGTFALIAFLLTGCSQTKITSIWVDQEYQGGVINDVFVVGVSRNGNLRRIFEDEFVSKFKQRGIKAISSYNVIAGKDLRDEKILASKVKESGSDTILLTRVLEIRKDTEYTLPNYGYSPPSYYHDGWHGYYTEAYLVGPGHAVKYETAMLESNLYDLRIDKLIWSARSDAPVGGNVGKHIKEFANSIINQLADAKLIK